MSQKSIILITVLFVLIVMGMFIYAHLKKTELREQPNNPEVVVEKNPYDYIDRIDAKHYFVDNVHTLVGEVNMPTPCDLLVAESEVRESYPEQVVIKFTVINNSDTCIQQITTQRFKVEANASLNASFSATFMGQAIDLNLIPAAPGEKPEDFEVFIKG